MSGIKTNSGKNLKSQWKIPATQVRYHKGGTFFMPLENFPGALCDPHGYILFETEEDYLKCSYLDIGGRVNVHAGVNRIPGYKKIQ